MIPYDTISSRVQIVCDILREHKPNREPVPNKGSTDIYIYILCSAAVTVNHQCHDMYGGSQAYIYRSGVSATYISNSSPLLLASKEAMGSCTLLHLLPLPTQPIDK